MTYLIHRLLIGPACMNSMHKGNVFLNFTKTLMQFTAVNSLTVTNIVWKHDRSAHECM